MLKEIDFKHALSSFEPNQEETVEIPGVCPHCHRAVLPEICEAYYTDSSDVTSGIVVLLCPGCSNFFVAIYNLDSSEDNGIIYPREKSKMDIDEVIRNISPMFCKIYEEACCAEQHDLMEIAGIGYRKALEFLVKDYTIHENPSDKEQIESELLAQSIKRIDNSNIQILASRAVWIGNDETHYIRKHENLDIEHMKRFIRSLLLFMASEQDLKFAASISKA